MFTTHDGLWSRGTSIGGHVVWFIEKIFNWPLISHIILALINGAWHQRKDIGENPFALASDRANPRGRETSTSLHHRPHKASIPKDQPTRCRGPTTTQTRSPGFSISCISTQSIKQEQCLLEYLSPFSFLRWGPFFISFICYWHSKWTHLNGFITWHLQLHLFSWGLYTRLT